MQHTPDHAPAGQATAYSARLDVASGDSLHPTAADLIRAAEEVGYHDPRRLYRDGRRARLLLENAREATAEALALTPGEVSFVPSGTHAVHLGLLGLLAGHSRAAGRPRVVTSAVEHSSVGQALDWAARTLREPPEIRSAPVDRLGRVDRPALDELLEGATLLALQAANPEVGTLQPIDDIAAGHPQLPIFCDLAAAVGRIPTAALPSTWSAAAASAHKWGGPAGVGLLLVRTGVRWRSPFPSDDRVDRRTVGFENIPAAIGAAAALRAVLADVEATSAHCRALVTRLRTALVSTIPDVEVVGDPDDRLPHVLTFSCLYVDGEALVLGLDRRGFSVSSGSACAAESQTPSHVLAAMGALTHGNVRVSLSGDATEQTVDALVAATAETVRSLRAEVGL